MALMSYDFDAGYSIHEVPSNRYPGNVTYQVQIVDFETMRGRIAGYGFTTYKEAEQFAKNWTNS